MINTEELGQLQSNGAVTLTPGFPEELLQAANEAIDGLDVEHFAMEDEGDAEGFYFEDIIQIELIRFLHHPFFEEVAKTVLRTSAVELVLVALRVKKPKPNAIPTLEPEHVDFKCGTDDYQASPVRMPCGFFIWLTDVGPDNFPLHYRPGSHLQVLRYMDEYPDDNSHEYKQKPPLLDYKAPLPIYAKAGQVTVLSSTLVHSGSVTPGCRERRLLVVDYKAKGTDFSLFVQNEEGRRRYLEALKQQFPADKLHLLP